MGSTSKGKEGKGKRKGRGREESERERVREGKGGEGCPIFESLDPTVGGTGEKWKNEGKEENGRGGGMTGMERYRFWGMCPP